MSIASSSPVMSGFTNPRLSREKKWRRRGIYALIAVLCFFYSALMLLLPMQVKVPFTIPLIVLIGLIIWALPLTNKPPGKVAERLFWYYSFTLLLWPNYLAIALPGLPWFTAARLLAAPMILIILVHASTSLPFKKLMREHFSAARPLWILVAIFAVIQVISVFVSANPILTLNRVFNNQVMWTGLFFAAVWALRDLQRLERWVFSYILMIFILGLLAIWEAKLGGVIWANSVPSIFQVDDENVQKILQGSYRLTGQYRVQTTATTPLSFAEAMAMAVPFLLYAMHKYPRPIVIVACLIVEGLIINGLIESDARLGFVGVLVGHILYLLYFAIERWRFSPKSIVGAALIVAFPAIIIAAALAVLFVGRIRVRVLGGGQHQWSDEARFEQMASAFEKIWQSPVFGFGAGEGGMKIGFFSPGGELTVDSYYLVTFMDYGFLGFFVYYGMLAYAIFVCAKIALTSQELKIRSLSATLGIFLTQFVIIKSVLAQEANHPLVFLVLGGVVTLAFASHRKNLAPSH